MLIVYKFYIFSNDIACMFYSSFTFTSQKFKKKTRVRIWIYEDVHVQMEGVIIGFDEYMNIVLDEAIEINTNSKQQQQKRINVGRCLLKGDAITLIQLRIEEQ